MSERVYNFSAGPAVLPERVLRESQQALWSLGDSGIGILEHSHRGPEFSEVIERAEALCRKLAGIPDGYSVMFLQGGASTQFFMVPMNLLGRQQTADYINTGTWSQKAMTEAVRFGAVHEAATSEPATDDWASFSYLPSADAYAYSSEPAYVHFTSNNTIRGTEFVGEPATPPDVPLICDASSDIFSRPINIAQYGMVYAGAQKNLGPSGLALVIADDALIERGASNVPTMLQYRTHAHKGSRFNTPPTFAIYVLGRVLAWIDEFGGLEAMSAYNRAKAQVIYDFLDDSELFDATVQPENRSLMNICFRCKRESLTSTFVTQAAANGLVGLAGHRSVGGMRASIYNAFPAAGCDALVAFMKRFEREHRCR